MAVVLSGQNEVRIYDSRYKYLYIAILFFTLLISSRLWYLQLYRGNLFKAYADKNRMWQEKDYAPRGMIFDRNGKLLVDNKLSFDVIVRPQYFSDDNSTLTKVASFLQGVTVQDIKLKLGKSKNLPLFYPVVIADNVSRDVLALIESNKFFIPGLDVVVRSKRTYLFGESMAHVIGYIGEVNRDEIQSLNYKYEQGDKKLSMGDYIGKFGLEMVWDYELRGVNGSNYVVVDANGRMKSEEESKDLFGKIPDIKSKPGKNLYLTIDSDLQEIAYKHFKEKDKKGAVVAIDPRTGEVLLMLSSPGFDPTTLSAGVNPEFLRELKNDPFKPFYNKVIQGQYSPGSTFKPIVAFAALEEGLASEKFKTTCPGRMWFGNRYYHCHRRYGHGAINLHDGIVKSCDIVFYRLGIALGVDNIHKYSTMLGLGIKTGIDLPDESPGLIPSSAWKKRRFNEDWMPGENLSVAIGQSYDLVTPLQLANAYAGMATKYVYRPYVLKNIKDVEGKTVYERPQKIVEHIIDMPDDKQEYLLKSMWGVVNEPGGTAWWYRLPGLDMAGKTGTVQLYRISAKDIYKKCEELEETKRHHGWFVGFAPYRDPEIVVAVMAEHACHGSSGAAPLVRDIIKAYHKKYGFQRELEYVKE
jgi:penicillin-binding protein 2